MTGTPAEIGLAGAAAFLAGQQWKDFDSLFVDAGHLVFIAPSAGNRHPMHFMKRYFTGLAFSILIFLILSRLVILLLLKPITSIPLPKPRRLTGGVKKLNSTLGCINVKICLESGLWSHKSGLIWNKECILKRKRLSFNKKAGFDQTENGKHLFKIRTLI